jgi:hypothetical protein
MTDPRVPGFVTFFDLPADEHPVLCSFALRAILFSVVGDFLGNSGTDAKFPHLRM